jgi:hypothetical protein
MLSGCVAFTVHDENGNKIAYYGIRMKDLKPVFHSSFNPELYLYNYHRIDPETDVHFTTDMFDCIRILSSGRRKIEDQLGLGEGTIRKRLKKTWYLL